MAAHAGSHSVSGELLEELGRFPPYPHLPAPWETLGLAHLSCVFPQNGGGACTWLVSDSTVPVLLPQLAQCPSPGFCLGTHVWTPSVGQKWELVGGSPLLRGLP